MQKIIFHKPFMGVQPCEIEFDRFLLLIGEQASGKSTIAKLIYFFQTFLKKDLIILCLDKNPDDGLKTRFQLETAALFRESFGLVATNKDIEISFYYDTEKDKYIRIYHNAKKRLDCLLSTSLLNQTFWQQQQEIIGNDVAYRDESGFLASLFLSSKKHREKSIIELINSELSTVDNNSYIIAARSNAVAYSEFFEKYFFANIIKSIDTKRISLQSNIDDKIMLEYLERVIEIKTELKGLNQIEAIAQSQDFVSQEIKESLIYEKYFLSEKMAHIMKGKYFIDNNSEEKLKVGIDSTAIALSETSSGQQEVIRILQDINLVIKYATPASRIIEEPEAHLYPTAQKEIVNLLALMLNANDKNTLIITTHSPYILACVNILLMANDVSKETKVNDKIVSDIVAKELWLDSKMFNAYSLGNTEVYCKNIKDEEIGMIDQNYLDLISEQLGLQYDKLFNLLLQNA